MYIQLLSESRWLRYNHMVCILNDKMYLRMDILTTVRNNFLWKHYKMCPCGVKSGNWIRFYKCIFGLTHDKVYITTLLLKITSHHITNRFCLLVKIKSEKFHWKLYSCFHAFALRDIYTGMVTGMLQWYKSGCSYYLGSWIMGNFPSYCIHQEYFLIRRWSLQWKGSCHWEHSCGLMGELSVIFGQSCVRNMIHSVYVKAAKPDFRKPLWYAWFSETSLIW
jgi:hypothetical protein